ncbi:MAG: hypothetical protein ACPHO4_11120 [Longimicrobiales bacterium]
MAAVASRPTSPSTSLPRDAILPENTALGAPDTASMVGKIPDLASRPSSPGLEDIPDPGDDRPSLAASPPPPRRHDYQTLLPHSLDAPSPRHIDPTLPPHSLAASPPPPRRHDYPTSPPDRPDAPGLSPSAPADLLPYRKTFSDDIKALPTEFTSHPARLAIVKLLELESDNTNSLWFRRAVYTEENFEQWMEWSSPSKTHRDQRPCLNDLSKETLLIAPDLLEADKKTLEDAWVVYRPYLLDKIQQALLVGCDWKRVLQKLHLAFSDSDKGYPRLKQYIEQALQDNALIKYPLLHADVLFYQLDASYSEKGTRNPNSTRWKQTLMREPGEDVVTLARRVEGAFLAKFHSPTITKETIYQLPESSDELFTRYKECLRNDVDNPARGVYMSMMCEEKWDQALSKYKKDQKTIIQMPDVTPKQFEQFRIVTTPPTLEDIAILLAFVPVEKVGNWDADGRQLNGLSASATDPHLIKFADGVDRVPQYTPGDLTWRNSRDYSVFVRGYDESREKPRRNVEPRSGMNSRDRRNIARARTHPQIEYKPSKPSKPPSYNTEPHGYDDVDAITKPHDRVPAGDPVFASSRHLKHQ